MTKNVIAYSLWGHKQRYVQGMRDNIQLAKEHYPGWKVWIYTNFPTVTAEEHVKIVWVSNDPVVGWEGTFWRFYAGCEGCRRVIFRDADSRLGKREKAAVDEWIAEDTGFHVMRDHQDHRFWPILAGMWGMKVPQISEKQEEWKRLLDSWPQKPEDKLNDQRFLATRIWPIAAHSLTHHSSIDTPHKPFKPFPEKSSESGFVGEIVEL